MIREISDVLGMLTSSYFAEVRTTLEACDVPESEAKKRAHDSMIGFEKGLRKASEIYERKLLGDRFSEHESPADILPPIGCVVLARLDDGSECIAMYDENDRRATWLLQGTGGQFWRSFERSVVSYRVGKR